jgi:AhpD family alkylhydroperoxidase
VSTTPASSSPRIDWETFQQIIPEMATGMAAITRAMRQSGMDRELIELIKIRVSQMNGCAYCVQYHLNDARKVAVAGEKLDLLTTWREAGIFSPRECAALEWAERVTMLATHHVSDDAYAALAVHFNEREIVFLTTAIGQINFWNRVAAPFRFTPPIPRSVA